MNRAVSRRIFSIGSAVERRLPLNSAELFNLRKLLEDKRINSTRSLVQQYNAVTDPNEEELLYACLWQCVNCWMELKPDEICHDDITRSYAYLAYIQSKEPGREDLAVRMFYNFRRDMNNQSRWKDVNIPEGLTHVLWYLRPSQFGNDPSPLTGVAQTLVEKLKSVQFYSKDTFNTLNPILLGLEQIWNIVLSVIPITETEFQRRSSCKEFVTTLTEIESHSKYLPLQYRVAMVKYTLKTRMKPAKELATGAGNLLRILKALRQLVTLDADDDDFESRWRELTRLFNLRSRDHSCSCSVISVLRDVARQVMHNMHLISKFRLYLYKALEIQHAVSDTQNQRFLRYGIIEQLKNVALYALEPVVSLYAASELGRITSENAVKEEWDKDRDVLEAILDALEELLAHHGSRHLYDCLKDLINLRINNTEVVRQRLGNEHVDEYLQRLQSLSFGNMSEDEFFKHVTEKMGLPSSEARTKITEGLKKGYTSSTFVQIRMFFPGEKIKTVTDFDPELVAIEEDCDHHTSDINNATDGSSAQQTLKTRRAVHMDSLFSDQFISYSSRTRADKTILIYGHPGTGKTILSKKLACKWASESWGRYLERVYLLPVRELTSKSNPAITLHYSIAKCCLSVKTEEPDSHYLDDIGNDLNRPDTLLILDGIDEGNANARDVLIYATTLPCKLLLLGRAHILDVVQTCASLKVECLGFNDIQLSEFIRSEIGDQADELLTRLQADPVLWDIAHMPVRAQIICSLWKSALSKGDRSCITTNRALLYTDIVNMIWQRFSDTGEGSCTDRDLVYSKLGEIAFRTLSNCESVITPAHVNEHSSAVGVKDALEKCGVLYAQLDGKTYSFVHQTFQQFFAGSYLSRLFQGQKHDADLPILEHKYCERFLPVLCFMVQDICRCGQLDRFLNVLEIIDAEPVDHIGVQHLILKIQLLESYLAVIDADQTQQIQKHPIFQVLISKFKNVLVALQNDIKSLTMVVDSLDCIPYVIRAFPEVLDAIMSDLVKGISFTNILDISWIISFAKYSPAHLKTIKLLMLNGSNDRNLLRGYAAVQQISFLSKAAPEMEETWIEIVQNTCNNAAAVQRAVDVQLKATVQLAAIAQIPSLFEARAETSENLRDFLSELLRSPICRIQHLTLQELVSVAKAFPERMIVVLDEIVKICKEGNNDLLYSTLNFLEDYVKALPKAMDLLAELVEIGCDGERASIRYIALKQLPIVVQRKPCNKDKLIELACSPRVEYAFVRRAALDAIASLAGEMPKYKQKLLHLVELNIGDKRKMLRISALRTISSFVKKHATEDNEMMNLLRKGLGDANPNVRQSAVECVGDFAEAFLNKKHELEQLLQTARQDVDIDVKVSATKQLGLLLAKDFGNDAAILDFFAQGCNANVHDDVRLATIQQLPALIAVFQWPRRNLVKYAEERLLNERYSISQSIITNLPTLMKKSPDMNETWKSMLDKAIQSKDANLSLAVLQATQNICKVNASFSYMCFQAVVMGCKSSCPSLCRQATKLISFCIQKETCGQEDWVDVVAELYKREDEDIRSTAIDQISSLLTNSGSVSTGKLIDLACRAAEDRSRIVRRSAMQQFPAVVRASGGASKTFELLKKCLLEGYPDVSAAAAQALDSFSIGEYIHLASACRSRDAFEAIASKLIHVAISIHRVPGSDDCQLVVHLCTHSEKTQPMPMNDADQIIRWIKASLNSKFSNITSHL